MRINGSFFLFLLIAGCGGGGGGIAPKLPEPVSAKGQVMLDGQPLSDASVFYVPSGTGMGSGATGVTDANGNYEMALDTGAKGVVPGNYKVWISRLVDPNNKPVVATAGQPPADLAARESLPPKYSDITNTMLKISVSPQGGVFDFKLNSK